MEYNEIPTAIKVLNSELSRCKAIIQHEIPNYTVMESREVKVSIGERTIGVNADALTVFLESRMVELGGEIKRLEGIHETLTKVAVGLIN